MVVFSTTPDLRIEVSSNVTGGSDCTMVSVITMVTSTAEQGVGTSVVEHSVVVHPFENSLGKA
jgi:hypothetical protein